MKTLILILALLSGCASLQNAGTAEYSVKPFATHTGAVICCEVMVRNGKEIANLEATVTKFGDDYSVVLKEQGVAAFEGQGITAGALKATIDSAVKAALSAALTPMLPALLP